MMRKALTVDLKTVLFPLHQMEFSMKQIFSAAFIVLIALAGPTTAHAQAKKTVKLTFTNRAKVEVQVYTIDHNNGHKPDENKRLITPNGQGNTQATIDAGGYIDVTFSILGKNDKNVSEYHCTDLKTSVGSKTELQYDVSMSGRKC
jgi:hypothetical protein